MMVSSRRVNGTVPDLGESPDSILFAVTDPDTTEGGIKHRRRGGHHHCNAWSMGGGGEISSL
jgi:hypothetical protein